MKFTLFMPYQDSGADRTDTVAEGYYADGQSYIDALRAEEESMGSVIFNTMAGGGLDSSTAYGAFGGRNGRSMPHIEERVAYAKCDCTLYSPNGAMQEDVDSMIDKFASQKEFLVMASLNMASMDAEFEEELMLWSNETANILKHMREMGGEWVDKNVPKRNMRLFFLNKSGKEVRFELEGSEIEERLARNRYIFYVKKMSLLK